VSKSWLKPRPIKILELPHKLFSLCGLAPSNPGRQRLKIRRVDARIAGALIALFERALGLYASLSGTPQTADQIAAAIGAAQSAETIHLILEHLSSNGRAKMTRAADAGATTFLTRLKGDMELRANSQ
jgi:hypothetical protein